MERPSKPALQRAGLVALFLLQVAFFVYLVSGFRYLPGTDAYYYAVQTQSLLDCGRLKVPDGGLLYYLIAAVARCGASIESAFKIVLAAIDGLCHFGFLLLCFRLKETVRVPAALLWALSSSVVAFHVIEFPNLSLGLALVPIWFLLVIGRPRHWMLWLSLILTASFFLHLLLAALVLAFVSTVVLGTFQAVPGPGRFSRLALIFGAIVCVLLVVVIALTRPGLGLRLASLRPGLPGIFSLIKAVDVPYDMKLTLLFFFFLAALILVDCWLRRSGKWKYLAVAMLAVPLWPDHDSGLLGLGARLAGMFIFPVLPLIAVALQDIGDTSRLFSWLATKRIRLAIVVATMAAIAVLPVRLGSYNGLLMNDDYAGYEKVVTALRYDDIPMLIAHRGLDFYYSYRLRRDAFHFDPEPNWERAAIWRVAARITPEEVAYYSPASCPWGQTARTIRCTEYILVREDCWEQLRARLNRHGNPDLYQEVWENMENPSQPRPAFLRVRYRE